MRSNGWAAPASARCMSAHAGDVSTAEPPAGRRSRPAFAAVALVILAVLVAAVTAIAVVITRGNAPRASSGVPPRVALVVTSSPAASGDPSAPYMDAIDRARTEDGIQAQTFATNLKKPGLPGRVRKSIGEFDLVVLAGQSVDARFVDVFARHPHTKFVVVDPDPSVGGPLVDAVSNNRNASDLSEMTTVDPSIFR